MKTPDTIDLSVLPESIRQQVYELYLSLKRQVEQRGKPKVDVGECALLSENALADGWLSEAEDEAWRDFQ